ncbi:MAG TPA: hypothetical protein V6D12_23255 [Candidatus Obscuribacterales bacterium]
MFTGAFYQGKKVCDTSHTRAVGNFLLVRFANALLFVHQHYTSKGASKIEVVSELPLQIISLLDQGRGMGLETFF